MNHKAEQVFEGKHLLVLQRDGWQFVERKKGKSAVVVLARTEDGKVVLTEQYRRPVNARVIEFPAGLVGDEEGGTTDPAETARRELEEETGYTCQSMELLASGPASPGITSEVVHIYRAHSIRRKGTGGGVGGEEITVHEVPLQSLPEWLERKTGEGLMVDVKVWAGLYFLS